MQNGLARRSHCRQLRRGQLIAIQNWRHGSKWRLITEGVILHVQPKVGRPGVTADSAEL